MSYFEKISSVPQPYQIDAFGRLRVSEAVNLFDSKQCVHNDSGVWDTQLLSGTSTFNPNTASTSLVVSGTSGAFAIRQTYQRMNYTPAKSLLIHITATDMNPQTDVIKRIGYFNSDFNTPYDSNLDGIYWQASGSTFSAHVANLGVIENAQQSNWNIDPLDGSGPSGKNVTDWSLNQIYFMDLEWLGVGSVRFGVILDGTPYYVHEFKHANVTKGVYMSSPNHSIRYGIRSIGGAGTLNHICSSVASEAGSESRFSMRSINNGISGVVGAAANAEWATLGLKLDTSVTNAAGLNLNLASLGVNLAANLSATGYAGWRVLVNPVVSGSISWLTLPNYSGVQYFVGAASNTIGNVGVPLAGDAFNSASKGDFVQTNTSTRIGVGISGNSDILVLSAWDSAGSSRTLANMNLHLQD
jgi:hypothetical protein